MLFTGLLFVIYHIIRSPYLLFRILIRKIKSWNIHYEKFRKNNTVVKFDKSRRAFLTTTGIAIAGYAFVGASAGILRKDNYEITYKTLNLKNLSPGLNGTTITLISDIHSGPYMSLEKMKEYVSVINDLGSDIIVIPGDLTNSMKEEVYPFIEAFKNLKAKYGVYATLGNHDYFSEPQFIADTVNKESPIKLLQNKSELININNKPLLILGANDNRMSGMSVDAGILNNINEAGINAKEISNSTGIKYEEINKILLYHKPHVYDGIKDKQFDLFLCGHTHGGQVVLGDFGNVHLSIIGSFSKYISGIYDTGNFPMYISRGIGTVGIPIRLNCPPEITKFTLNS